MVDPPNRTEKLQPLRKGYEGTIYALQVSDRLVTVDANDEAVAERPCLPQTFEMSGVQQVEAAVGEDDALAAFAVPHQSRGDV